MVDRNIMVDKNSQYCATCKYWSGKTQYYNIGMVKILDGWDQQAQCNGIFYPAEKRADMVCSSWVCGY